MTFCMCNLVQIDISYSLEMRKLTSSLSTLIVVLEVGDGVFEVLSTSGDTHLGGDDFDKVEIIEYDLFLLSLYLCFSLLISPYACSFIHPENC